MMPLSIIIKELVQAPVVIDLEVLAARLEHHHIALSISNHIGSDCGDRWIVEVHDESDQDEETKMTEVAPTLRQALSDALHKFYCNLLDKQSLNHINKPYRRMTPEEYARDFKNFPPHRAEVAMSVKNSVESMEVVVYMVPKQT